MILDLYLRAKISLEYISLRSIDSGLVPSSSCLICTERYNSDFDYYYINSCILYLIEIDSVNRRRCYIITYS